MCFHFNLSTAAKTGKENATSCPNKQKCLPKAPTSSETQAKEESTPITEEKYKEETSTMESSESTSPGEGQTLKEKEEKNITEKVEKKKDDQVEEKTEDKMDVDPSPPDTCLSEEKGTMILLFINKQRGSPAVSLNKTFY